MGGGNAMDAGGQTGAVATMPAEEQPVARCGNDAANAIAVCANPTREIAWK